jgi:hypothetical protein
VPRNVVARDRRKSGLPFFRLQLRGEVVEHAQLLAVQIGDRLTRAPKRKTPSKLSKEEGVFFEGVAIQLSGTFSNPSHVRVGDARHAQMFSPNSSK